MFVVLLRFLESKPKAGEFMQAHNEYIIQGLVAEFFLTGSIE